MLNKINYNFSILPIITFINNIKNENLDLQSTYQKEYIWNNEMRENFIYSIIKHYPIGNIIIRNLDQPNKKNAKIEIIDGRQRIMAILKFIIGEFKISEKMSKKIIEKNIDCYEEEAKINKAIAKILKKYKENKKLKLSFLDLPIILKNDIETFPLTLTFISNISTEDIYEYFGFIEIQEKMRIKEISQSFSKKYLEKYLNMLENKEKLFLVIGFKNKKNEFEKIFYSIIGILENKIKLGCTDKSIEEYVKNKKNELEEIQMRQIQKMIINLNIISQISLKDIKINSNKRYLKLLLLLCSLGNLDFSKNGIKILLTLELINKKLSVFNSSKNNILEETFFNEEDKIENYKKLNLLMKGTQKLITVKERIDFLEKELINEE